MHNDTTEVRIPLRIATELLDHAQRDTEREVCGLIAARDGQPVRCVPILNIAGNPANRYRMDPVMLIKALYRIECEGEELFGIYHSHPKSPAAPSAIDVIEARHPQTLYLIISLNTKGVLEMRGYNIREGEAREVGLAIG